MGDRRIRRWISLAAAGLAIVATGCSGGGSAETTTVTWVALDGSPRPPADAGVLTALDEEFAFIVLDGETTYDLSETVQSFASADGSTQPLTSRQGQYVQVGIEDGKVVWLAGIGAVVRVPGQADHVLYIGRIVSVEGRTVTLLDGTVLQLAKGVEVDGEPSREHPLPALLQLDVATDSVVAVQGP